MLSLVVVATLAASSWTPIAPHRADAAFGATFIDHWLVVVGRSAEGYGGAALDLRTSKWVELPTLDLEEVDASSWAPQLPAPHLFNGELFFYFGHRPAEPPARPRPYAAGARFDLAKRTWRPMNPDGAPIRGGAAVVQWSAGTLAVFRPAARGMPPLSGYGAIYDAASDAWTPIEGSGSPQVDPEGQYTFTGIASSRVLLTFGRSRLASVKRRPGGGQLDFSYDLLRRQWRPIAAGAPADDIIPAAGWDGARAFVIGASASGQGFEGGWYDLEHDAWTPAPPPPAAVYARTAQRLGPTLALPIECGPGAHGGRGLAVLDLASGRWTTPCALKALSQVIFDQGRALIVERPDAASRKPEPIRLYVWEPGRSSWRSGLLPVVDAPANLKERRYGSEQLYATLHFDGSRLWSWGGTAVQRDPNGRTGCEGVQRPCDPTVPTKQVPIVGGLVGAPRWE